MASYIEKHITHRNGDTLESSEYHLTINGSDVNLTDCSIRMQVKEDDDSIPVLDLTVGDGFTLTDAVGGVFTRDQIDELLIEPNISKTYKYDIQITFSNGKNKTYTGGLFKLIATVSDKG